MSEPADVECDEDVEDVRVDVEAVVEGQTRDFVHQKAAGDEVSDDGSAEESEVNLEVCLQRHVSIYPDFFLSVFYTKQTNMVMEKIHLRLHDSCVGLHALFEL